MQTHESYIAAVVQAAKEMVKNDPEKLAKIERVKIVYGLGSVANTRGVTYYDKWSKGDQKLDLIEVCAFGQSNWTQVAGTTVHELAHVIAGHAAGHGPIWKAACDALGLRLAKAAGMNYQMASFKPALRNMILSVALPQDGTPIAVANALGVTPRAKPCTMGIGTRGGKSRGTGSGSRLLKCECPRCGYTVRVTRKWLDKGEPICPTDEIKMKEC